MSITEHRLRILLRLDLLRQRREVASATELAEALGNRRHRIHRALYALQGMSLVEPLPGELLSHEQQLRLGYAGPRPGPPAVAWSITRKGIVALRARASRAA